QASTQTGQRQRVAVDDLAAGQRFANLDQLVTGNDQRHRGATIDGDVGYLNRSQNAQILRTQPAAARQYHISAADILTDSADILERRNGLQNVDVLLVFLRILRHDHRI